MSWDEILGFSITLSSLIVLAAYLILRWRERRARERRIREFVRRVEEWWTPRRG